MAMSLTDLQKKRRLASEYRDVLKIPITNAMRIKVVPNGKPVEETRTYLVTYNIETRVKKDDKIVPQYRTVVRFDLGPDFPASAPTVTIVEGLVPWHVNWYTSGRLCPGNMWHQDPFLYKFLIKVGKTISFSPEYTNPGSPANSGARQYWTDTLKKFPLADIHKLPSEKGKL